MDFLQKYLNGVFELPLPRNTQKLTKQKGHESVFGVGWFLGSESNSLAGA
jgi:hypothetical protein